MTIAWVIGNRGLLGTSLTAELRRSGTELFAVAEQLQWSNADMLRQQIAKAASQFAIAAVGQPRWEIYWAAGVGTIGSGPEVLNPETAALSYLLEQLAKHAHPVLDRGYLALASSAGAIYAGTSAETKMACNTCHTGVTTETSKWPHAFQWKNSGGATSGGSDD